MVRMVDEVLRTRFGLPMGIADAATWQEAADRNGFDVPVGVDPDKPFVSMVDPATGTGTFLVEWLRRAHKSFLASGEASNWPGHLREHVLPSMHAFENMLAPYAIAHLKVALELHDAGAGEGRRRSCSPTRSTTGLAKASSKRCRTRWLPRASAPPT